MRPSPQGRNVDIVRSGLDVLITDEARLSRLRGARVALLAHAASVASSYEHAVVELQRRQVDVVRVFAPEHGLHGTEQMMVGIAPASAWGVPVASMYGETLSSLRPPEGTLDDVDLVLIDVQDVGARYYTYVASALYLAQAASRRGIETWVLDRPNPIGRVRQGPPRQAGFESFVGVLDVPSRHGLTCGELFGVARDQGYEFHAEIVPCEGWQPAELLDESRYRWAMPSPNMPGRSTALVYPGMCLLEATNISEGRGTTRPFELFGAPWLDARRLKQALDALNLPGIAFRETAFKPAFDKYAGEGCGALQLHVLDPSSYDPLSVAAATIYLCAELFGSDFHWRPGAYEFVEDIPAIDLLSGSPQLRELIESRAGVDEACDWAQAPEAYHASFQRYELYGP